MKDFRIIVQIINKFNVIINFLKEHKLIKIIL